MELVCFLFQYVIKNSHKMFHQVNLIQTLNKLFSCADFLNYTYTTNNIRVLIELEMPGSRVTLLVTATCVRK